MTPDEARGGEGGPPPLVGVLGGGQLGRMLALAGIPMGLRFRFFDPGPAPPVLGLGEVVHAGWSDLSALRSFARGTTAVTYEFENVPLEAVDRVGESGIVLPPPHALAVAQDRLAEKELFHRLGIDTAPFLPVASRSELDRAAAELGLPAVLKTRHLGYDGKGQRMLSRAAEFDAAWDALGGRPLILEGYVPFLRELSVLAVRSREGEVLLYPLVENEHREGILRTSRAPALGVAPAHRREAERIAARIMGDLGYVGVLALELFETPQGVLANEMAPRVHNSGHWTQDGAVTSQFENHLRAVLGLPLGSTAPRGVSGMVNLIGTLPIPSSVLAVTGAHLHLYGKVPRPGRKLGHVNVVADDLRELERRIGVVQGLLEPMVLERRQAAQASHSP